MSLRPQLQSRGTSATAVTTQVHALSLPPEVPSFTLDSASYTIKLDQISPTQVKDADL